MEQPQYEHKEYALPGDVFLGRFTGKHNRYDLYFRALRPAPTEVAMWGGPVEQLLLVFADNAFWTVPDWMMGSDDNRLAGVEAKRRATARGLLTPREPFFSVATVGR